MPDDKKQLSGFSNQDQLRTLRYCRRVEKLLRRELSKEIFHIVDVEFNGAVPKNIDLDYIKKLKTTLREIGKIKKSIETELLNEKP